MKRLTKPNLVRLAMLVGGVALAAKVVTAKKNRWKDLNEAEVRAKIETRLPDRVPEEKRTAVADKVVTTMKTRGLLAEGGDEITTEVPADVESDIAVGSDADDESSN